MTEIRRSPAIVIGSGLAGIYAALRLAEHMSVLLISQADLEMSNSWYAQGGVAAAVGDLDAPALHEADTLEAGRGLCDPEAVRVLTTDGPERMRDLAALGVEFDREGGEVVLGLEGGHRRRRILHVNGSATGRGLVEPLLRRLQEHPRISVLPGVRVEALLSDGSRCFGVRARSTEGEPLLGLAGATVLATGGAGALFERTTNPATARGEGIALAWRAGATVADLEFVQFHPTALAVGGEAFLLSEAVRGEGAWLLDARGQRFMTALDPLAELAPRDVVARAIWQQMRETGAAVTLSLAHLDPERVRYRFPNLVEAVAAVGLDLTRDPIPVAPAAHYLMGGVVTDLDGSTSLDGLYAAGEVACSGIHGANRLASNSLLECVVFAHRAAARIIAEAAPVPTPRPWAKTHVCVDDDADLWQALRATMSRDVGLERSAAGLRAAAVRLEVLREQAHERVGADSSLGLALDTARLIGVAAAIRTESRGSHWRLDAAAEDPAWRVRIAQRRGTVPCLIPTRGGTHALAAIAG